MLYNKVNGEKIFNLLCFIVIFTSIGGILTSPTVLGQTQESQKKQNIREEKSLQQLIVDAEKGDAHAQTQ
ncbi:MAG: hypothetical protein RR719_09725, partial [Akkermansia sp.]